MSDTATTLQTLDGLLEAWDLLDLDSTLLEIDADKRHAVKREAVLKYTMEMASLEQLRKNHMVELLEQYREGCAEYLYALVRVHTSYEFSYHELLRAICGGRHPDLYEGEKIRLYWDQWWSKKGGAAKYSTLRWRSDSPNLDAALMALTCSRDGIAPLLAHPHALVRQSLARRRDLDEETQWELTDDPAPIVRFELATNSNTSPDVLAELANDLNSIVRRWVACHPETPVQALNQLGRDPVDDVRAFLDKRQP